MNHCENYYEENVFPQLEVLGYSDREMLSRLLSSVRMRNETWENLLDAAADSEHAFRKVLFFIDILYQSEVEIDTLRAAKR